MSYLSPIHLAHVSPQPQSVNVPALMDDFSCPRSLEDAKTPVAYWAEVLVTQYLEASE